MMMKNHFQKKIFPATIFLTAAMLCILKAAPVGTVEIERAHFGNKSGHWNNPKDWRSGKIPQGVVRVYIPHGITLTVSGQAANEDVINLGVGGDKKTTLIITRGAKAKFSSLNVPGQEQKGNNGVLYLRDGELSIGNDAEKRGTLFLGQGLTHSGTGYAEFSGGKFVGGMRIGNSTPGTQQGTLVIKGSKVSVTTRPDGANFLDVGATGTIEFELDEKGVSTLQYMDAMVRLNPGATVHVNGAAYKGGPKTITLIATKDLRAEGAKYEAVNFSDDYEAQVKPEKKRGQPDSIVLKITRVR